MQKQLAAAWAVAGTAVAVAVIVVTGSTVGLFGARGIDGAANSVLDASAPAITSASVAPDPAGLAPQPAPSALPEQVLAQASVSVTDVPIIDPGNPSDASAYTVYEERDHDDHDDEDEDDDEHEGRERRDREDGDRDGWSLLSLVRDRHDD